MKNNKENRIQTGLRIPEKRYEELAEIADEVGVSINSLILMLIDMGLSLRKCKLISQREEK